MNIRKAVDYSTMFVALKAVMKAVLPQMELYCKVGQIVCARLEKGAAVAAAEFLKEQYPDMNCTPFVRQVWYNTCTKEWGVFSMPKGVPNKRYTPEFKKLVVETMQEEKLSYSETCRRFEVNSRDRIKSWERIYLEEGAEGLAIERRGRCSKGRPPKQLPKQVEEDLLAEAIAALLDVDALRASKNQETDIRAALEALKKDNGYLFESETPPPYSNGTGTNGGGHIFRFFRKKRKNLLQSSCSGVVYSCI